MYLYIFFERLLHYSKVLVGNFVSKFLHYVLTKVSVSRLNQAFLNSQPLIGYSYRILIQPTTLNFSKPQFFIEGADEKIYLHMLANYGNKRTPASGIICANNVIVSLPNGVHLFNGKVFEESLLGTELLTNPKYFVDIETISLRRKNFFPEAILLSLPWHHNFFHWMIEILPRLMLYDLAEDIHHLKLVVPVSSPKFIRESLKLTGYENKVSFFEDGIYRFDKLHILSRLSKTADVSPFAIEWLNNKINIPNIDTYKKRIYVSRSDAKNRYVSNELEIQNVLFDFGFEVVTMSQYTLEEQIRIFKQAEVVIGSHGAAFANIAFMRSQTIFIEFFESGHFNRCFYRMACLKNIKYGFLVGHKKGLGFSIDVTQLKNLLNLILS